MKEFIRTTLVIRLFAIVFFFGFALQIYNHKIFIAITLLTISLLCFRAAKYYLRPHIAAIKREISNRQSLKENTIILKLLLLWE